MVGIIPKPIKKTPEWHNSAIYIAFALLIMVVLAYALLFYFENKASVILSDVEEEMAQIGTQEEKKTEAKVVTLKKKIDDFSKLFQDHKITSNFLKFLEETAHPKIWFSELVLDSENVQASLLGQASNFQTLGQQIFIFQEQELIQKVNLTNLAIGDEGQIEFSISLLLNPQIFK